MRNDGLLIVDKPAGISSGKLVAKLRKKFGWSKVGHGGTLDPFASGVMTILVGEATKVARFLLGGSKSYEALAKIGFETDTGDLEGKPLHDPTYFCPNISTWRRESKKFVGPIQQVPPMYAAIKHEGRALYKFARDGIEITRKPRTVIIENLKIISAGGGRVESGHVRFQVECSAGTYIRVLAQDLARSVGVRVHLIELRRLSSKSFGIEEAANFDELLEMPKGERPPLLPIEEVLRDVPRVECGEQEAKRISVGDQSILTEVLRRNQKNQCKESQCKENQLSPLKPPPPYTLITCEKIAEGGLNALALVKFSSEKSTYVIERVFV